MSNFKDQDKKVVLITGGSGEIGSSISKIFADNNYNVVLTFNSNAKRANEVVKSLKKGEHYAYCAPTTDSGKVAELYEFVEEKYGRLDILVNNAGITTPVSHDDLDGLSDEWIDKIMQTNFRGSFAMVRAFTKLLMNSSNETGLIVNISSIAGIFGIGSNVAYCASKAALDSMTRSLARVLAPKIRVVSVSPGFVEGEYTANIDPNFLRTQKEHTPLGKFAMSDDVSRAVFSTATQLTFSTGNIITVDGGRLLK